jgi:hypothetical protein
MRHVACSVAKQVLLHGEKLNLQQAIGNLASRSAMVKLKNPANNRSANASLRGGARRRRAERSGITSVFLGAPVSNMGFYVTSS